MSDLREQAYRAAYETLRHSEGFDWTRDAGLLAQSGTRREIQRGVDAALAVVRDQIVAIAGEHQDELCPLFYYDVLALLDGGA